MGWIQGAADLAGFGDFWGMLSHASEFAKFSLENGKKLTDISSRYLTSVENLPERSVGSYIKAGWKAFPNLDGERDLTKLDIDAKRKLATRIAKKRLAMRDLGKRLPGISEDDLNTFSTAREYGLKASNARKQYFNWKSLSLGQRTTRYGLFGAGTYGVGNFAYRNTFGRDRYEY